MENIIPIVAIVLIVGGALAYIIRAKKSGKKCIGCPDAPTCGKNDNASSGGCSGSCGSCGGCHEK